MMRRPGVFLWNGEPKNNGRLEYATILRRLRNKESNLEKKRSKEENRSENLDELKLRLSRVVESNRLQLKLQTKLLNQLKQKNLEKYYYKMQIKKQRRLCYLLQLETACRNETGAFNFDLQWYAANLLAVNSFAVYYACAFYRRLKDVFFGWMRCRCFYFPK